MGWRKYGYWSKTSSDQILPCGGSEWVFRGCYWRWLAPRLLEFSSKEEEIKRLEALLSSLRRRVKKIEERISELRNSKI